MDFLRQKIEASLGRSEELLISDKARHTFYRYPPDPGPPLSKKHSKDRSGVGGTFNSVRLKKYLGLGSSASKRSKQPPKVDDDPTRDQDELRQQLQQQAYLEELARYGSPMPAGPALYYDGAAQVAVYPPSYPSHPWMLYGGGPGPGGTVNGRGAVYSSVNVRSNGPHHHHHQRAALRKALCAWEPFPSSTSSPTPSSATRQQPSKEVFDRTTSSASFCCTCIDQSSKKHGCNHCTCHLSDGGGPRSRRGDVTSRTTMLGQGVDHVRHNIGGNGSGPRATVSASNLYVDMPRPASVKQYSKNAVPTRRSILECPVNPYELIGSVQPRTGMRTATPRIGVGTGDDADERLMTRNCTTSPPPLGKNSKDIHEVRNRFNSSKVAEDANSCVTNISLGGQRIRLFDTVRGTMSVGGSSSPSKRLPLPSFADVTASTTTTTTAATSSSSLPSPSKVSSNFGGPVIRRTDRYRPKVPARSSSSDGTVDVVSVTTTSRPKDDWNFGRPYRNSAIEYVSNASPKHRTTISIGRSASEERILANGNDFYPFFKSRSDSCLREDYDDVDDDNIDNGDGRDNVSPTTATVIAIGSSEPASGRHARLKINLSELSAYLKPILKKAGLNESSSTASLEQSSGNSSDNSTAVESSLTRELRAIGLARHKQKKRVHFLSNRPSTGSEGSLVLMSSSSEHLPQPSSTTSMSAPASIDELMSAGVLDAGDSSDASSSVSSLRDLYDDVMYIGGSSDDVAAANVKDEDGRERTSDRPEAGSKLDSGNDRGTGNKNSERLDTVREPKLTNLHRSHSDRQNTVSSDDPAVYSQRPSSTRRKSLQCFPPTPPTSRSSLGGSSDDSDVNASVLPRDATVDDGDDDGPSRKILTLCDPNNLNSPSEDVPKKYNAGKDNILRQSAIVFKNNFADHGDRRHCQSGSPAIEAQSSTTSTSSSSSSSVPKFLPRLSYRMTPVVAVPPTCGPHDDRRRQGRGSAIDDSTDYSEDNSRGDTFDSSDWTDLQSQSEEDFYADGMSSVPVGFGNDRKCINEPLPAIPTAIPSLSTPPEVQKLDSTSSSLDDSGADSAIYEQIREPAEPLYEEVPDAMSCTSTSSAGSVLGQPRKSIFEGASRIEILSYLEDAKERGLELDSVDPSIANRSSIESTGSDRRTIDDDAEDEEEDEDERPEHVTGLNQTVGAKRNHRNRVSNLSNLSDSSQTSEESFQNDDLKDTKDRHSHSSAEVERNDSGVGSETSKPSRLRRQSRVDSSEQICVDCDQNLEPIYVTEIETSLDQLVCRKCSKKRSERKEIILEIVETEIKYGRDLKIIKEEFHRPMLVAGLLSEELLSNIFLNLDQLVEVNDLFAERLKDALEIAAEQGDEDYSTVNVGKIFQDSSAMLHAFEAYCVRQGTASLILTNLEKEKELLRIFLKVSQMENTLLRRLNLNSFLMVPVQRVTKYPLLLNRLYKVTPHHHQDRESLREAQLKIELHLEHINQQAKDLSGMNLWRRISNISNSQRKNILEPVLGNVKLRKMSLQVLQWNSDDARFALEGRLLYAAVSDNVWNKREKTLKLIPVHGLLITLGTPNSNYRPDLADRDDQMFPRNTGIKETCLVLIKEKGNRFNLLREPLQLQRCVISSEPDFEDIFEVQELTTKDAYLLKAEDPKDTAEWLRLLRYHAKDLGAWRRRRNALANIMINGMVARRGEWL